MTSPHWGSNPQHSHHSWPRPYLWNNNSSPGKPLAAVNLFIYCLPYTADLKGKTGEGIALVWRLFSLSLSKYITGFFVCVTNFPHEKRFLCSLNFSFIYLICMSVLPELCLCTLALLVPAEDRARSLGAGVKMGGEAAIWVLAVNRAPLWRAAGALNCWAVL